MGYFVPYPAEAIAELQSEIEANAIAAAAAAAAATEVGLGDLTPLPINTWVGGAWTFNNALGIWTTGASDATLTGYIRAAAKPAQFQLIVTDELDTDPPPRRGAITLSCDYQPRGTVTWLPASSSIGTGATAVANTQVPFPVNLANPNLFPALMRVRLLSGNVLTPGREWVLTQIWPEF